MTRRSPRAARRGFTLAEVLVAAGIFVAAAAALLRLLSIGSDNADFALRTAEGVLLAENRLAEFDAGLAVPQAVTGQTDPGFPRWQYDIETETAADYLLRVTVAARYAGPASALPAEVRITRLFFDAVAASEAADEAAASMATTTTAAPAAGGS